MLQSVTVKKITLSYWIFMLLDSFILSKLFLNIYVFHAIDPFMIWSLVRTRFSEIYIRMQPKSFATQNIVLLHLATVSMLLFQIKTEKVNLV